MMNDVFTHSFLSMGEALLRIFLIVVLAGALVRKKIISQEQITGLSKITVIVLLPALVISNTLQHFNPDALPYWWLIPLLGIAMSLAGVLLGYLVFATDYRKHKNLIAIASMQNAGYLVLPIAQVLYPEHFHRFALYIFLFILGYNPVLWSLGKYLVTDTDTQVKFEYKSLITPPAVANVASLLLVLLGWQHIFPKTFVGAVDLLGQAAVPMATFILGATLGTVSLKRIPKLWQLIRTLGVKYLLLPILTMAILQYFHLGQTHPLLADFFMIQAAAAPATGLILQVRTYGGDTEKVSATMLVAYLFCLIALPFWLAYWHGMTV